MISLQESSSRSNHEVMDAPVAVCRCRIVFPIVMHDGGINATSPAEKACNVSPAIRVPYPCMTHNIVPMRRVDAI